MFLERLKGVTTFAPGAENSDGGQDDGDNEQRSQRQVKQETEIGVFDPADQVERD